MKKIFPLFLALTVLTGCSEETEPTPGLAPVGGVISLRSESQVGGQTVYTGETVLFDTSAPDDSVFQ